MLKKYPHNVQFRVGLEALENVKSVAHGAWDDPGLTQ